MGDSILPDAEALRRAVRWISDQRRLGRQVSRIDLVDEAGRRFDLSPGECEFLIRALDEPAPEPPGDAL